MSEEKKEVKRYTTPEGRLINSALFTRDIFKSEAGGEGKPRYTIEMAFEPGVLDGIIEEAFNVAADAFGDDVQLDVDGGTIQTPLKNGDDLAASREAKGKKGDAYKGKTILRADTQYNKNGELADGGIHVYDLDVSEIAPANKDKVYNGCMGVAAFTIGTYTVNKTKGVKFYLVAFQKTGEGERLTSPASYSNLFKPVGRPVAAEGATPARKRRVA